MKEKCGSLRPVGEVLQLLTSKRISHVVSRRPLKFCIYLLQVSVGVMSWDGMRCVQDDTNIPPGSKCFLLLDFSNVSKCNHCTGMFKEVGGSDFVNGCLGGVLLWFAISATSW